MARKHTEDIISRYLRNVEKRSKGIAGYWKQREKKEQDMIATQKVNSTLPAWKTQGMSSLLKKPAQKGFDPAKMLSMGQDIVTGKYKPSLPDTRSTLEKGVSAVSDKLGVKAPLSGNYYSRNQAPTRTLRPITAKDQMNEGVLKALDASGNALRTAIKHDVFGKTPQAYTPEEIKKNNIRPILNSGKMFYSSKLPNRVANNAITGLWKGFTGQETNSPLDLIAGDKEKAEKMRKSSPVTSTVLDFVGSMIGDPLSYAFAPVTGGIKTGLAKITSKAKTLMPYLSEHAAEYLTKQAAEKMLETGGKVYTKGLGKGQKLSAIAEGIGKDEVLKIVPEGKGQRLIFEGTSAEPYIKEIIKNNPGITPKEVMKALGKKAPGLNFANDLLKLNPKATSDEIMQYADKALTDPLNFKSDIQLKGLSNDFKLRGSNAIPKDTNPALNEINNNYIKNTGIETKNTINKSFQEKLATLDNNTRITLKERGIERNEPLFEIADEARPDIQAARKISDSLGLDTVFVNHLDDNANFFNGKYQDGTIFINVKNTENPANVVLGHEFIHDLSNNSPELFDEFVNVFGKEIDKIKSTDYRLKLNNATLLSTGQKLDDVAFLKEAAGDFSGEMFNDPKIIGKLVQESPNVAQRVVQYIQQAIEKLKAVVNPDYQVKKYLKDLQKVEGQYLDTMKRHINKRNLKPGEILPGNVIQDELPFSVRRGAIEPPKRTLPQDQQEIFEEISTAIGKANTTSDEYIKDIAPTIKDKSGFSYNTTNVYRNLKDAFGKNFEYVQENYLNPFNASKKSNIDFQRKYTDELNEYVINTLGIKPNSKESKAVQWFGEKKKLVGSESVVDPQTGKKFKQPKLEDYTLVDLKKEFPDTWENIVKADDWFRTKYNDLIDKVNESRATIYPNVENNIKRVNEEIAEIESTLGTKIQDRFDMTRGRNFETNKEIDIKSQINRLETRKSKLQDNLKLSRNSNYNDKVKSKIESIEKQLSAKKEQLKKANAYRQPTAKQFEKLDTQIKRLEELKKQKEELLESDKLWKNKRIQKREDYYRHFKDMSDSFAGVKNMFETPSQIDPSLVGISENTQPMSKYAGIFQRRGKGFYDADAIGGFLDYIKTASYAVNIDPHIGRFRQLAKDVVEGSGETKNANNLIMYLQDYANDLSGKTNRFDRLFQDIVPGGRTIFRVLNWANNRVKSNTVLGNAGSTLAQMANIPLGISHIKNPLDLTKGFGDTISGFIGGKANNLYKESQFIAERFSDDIYSKFDTKILDQPKKFAAWMLRASDEIGTKFIWNSSYRNAVRKGVTDPLDAIQMADDITRNLVAGRGIGEVPLFQKSKVFNVFAPFQLEVANQWHVMKDFVSKKDFGGIAMLMAGNFMLNRVMEETRGSAVTFDPIKAVYDSFKDETTPLQKAGRLGGEVLSNFPLGQTIAEQFPDDFKKEYFGRNDPTRFGTGLLLTKGLEDYAFKLLPPFGGSQIKKTYEGLKSTGIIPDLNPFLNKNFLKVRPGEYQTNSAGEEQLKYPVKSSTGNIIKGALFGKGATDESKAYYRDGLKPLSANQTAIAQATGIPLDKVMKGYQIKRKLDNSKNTPADIEKYKKELIKYYNDTGDVSVFSSAPGRAITIKYGGKGLNEPTKKTFNMSDSEYKQYLQEGIKLSKSIIKEVSGGYGTLNDKQKYALYKKISSSVFSKLEKKKKYEIVKREGLMAEILQAQ